MSYSNDFMAMFELHVPILQGPIGPCATLDLVRAVGQAGGMGSLALTELPLEQCEQYIAALNALHVPYFVNYLLRFGTATVRDVAAMQPPCITLSWGLDPALIADVRRKGVKVGIMVGSVKGAGAAVSAGADFLILQGMEAVGHVQASRPLTDMLTAVVALAGAVPVVAAGGIAAGADIAAALAAGAQAVMLGTRYLATVESLAHARLPRRTGSPKGRRDHPAQGRRNCGPLFGYPADAGICRRSNGGLSLCRNRVGPDRRD